MLGFWVANGLPETPMPKCVGSYLRFGSVRIEVHDEGPGITQQGKEILFQEGVQLNPNQLQSGQGLFTCLFASAFFSISHSPDLALSLLDSLRIWTWIVDRQRNHQYSWRCDRSRV
jgi:hypothetical protein